MNVIDRRDVSLPAIACTVDVLRSYSKEIFFGFGHAKSKIPVSKKKFPHVCSNVQIVRILLSYTTPSNVSSDVVILDMTYGLSILVVSRVTSGLIFNRGK